jgi:integrase
MATTGATATAATAMTPYVGTSMAKTRTWATLPADELRRRAMDAAQAHDTTALWELTEAHLTLTGAAGANVSPRTLSTYRSAITRLVTQDGRAWDLLKPQRNAAHLWIREMETHGLKPSSVRTYLAAARALYAALRWSGATTVDPFTDSKPGTDPVPREEKRKPYTDDQVAQLLRVAFTDHERLLVLLCGHAGLRASEAVALRWAEIDLATGRLVVASGKGGKKRTIPLSGTLRRELALERDRPDGDYVLPYRDRRSAWYHLKEMAQRAAIPALGVHALRHTAGTRMMRQTGSLEITARLLGHAQIETTRIYAKFADDTLDDAVRDW